MKKLLLAVLVLVTVDLTSAQSPFIGTWEGILKAGADMRIYFRIAQDDQQNLTALMDAPDQGLKDVKVSDLVIAGDSISLTIPQFQASYAGSMNGDGTINGTFRQGMAFPLNLTKVMKIAEVKRPQTPVPPFPYRSEDVTYTSNDNAISYGATITIPNGTGPFPAAVLLTGSGPQNRDEEIAGHKPFAVLADHLTRNGFIVLRVDDRGVGQTTGDATTATTRDFADDANVSLNYLKSRAEVDTRKIGMIGHSEGGMIAQIVAAERDDIHFVVMLAAPGMRIPELMSEQTHAVLSKSGLPADYVTAYVKLYNNVIASAIASQGDDLSASVTKVVDQWVSETPQSIVQATTGIRDESSKVNFVNTFAGQIGTPWFRYFLQYDPAVNVQKIRANVLAVNGSEDVQVVSKPNLAAIELSLKKGKANSFEVRELSGLNHLFQECKSCTLAEYGQLDQTLSPVLLETVTAWMKRVAK